MSIRIRIAGRIIASVVAVGALTAAYGALVRVNPTTIALSYVVVILLIATAWGIAESTVASVAAMLCFNFFFLPPVGTLTIADPQNWVALVAFLATAIVASQLSGRARARNIEVVSRQRDLERLYALSRALLLSESGGALPGAIARYIAEAFGVRAVGVYDQRADAVAWAGQLEVVDRDDILRDAARRGVQATHAGGLKVIAIQLGGRSVGSVAFLGADLSDTVLNSIANLAAIGLERARGEEATARAEAARHSSELRATVLDALAHEFKTPLTSMKAASADLLASTTVSPRDHELAAILDEELDSLQSLVSDAVQMLRIDAGDFVVHRERHALEPIVRGVLRRFELRLDGHQVVRQIPPDFTVDADRGLLALALRQLVDNAVKYSPHSSTIAVGATSNGSVDITVRNTGSTIPESERPRVVERYYRGARARNIPGTGMGLPIVQQIAQAHGGSLSLESSDEQGTAFTISLPRGKDHGR
ncbi:MAG TPA: ATP-binding protein [Vicinamibacterales bacterium]|nr:ATP-binding protein [Vicinamibacterales bacterium]